MLEEMKLKRKKQKENNNELTFKINKKNTVITSKGHSSQIQSTLKDFVSNSTREISIPLPKEEMCSLSNNINTYSNTSPNITTAKQTQMVSTIAKNINSKPVYSTEKAKKEKIITQLNLSITNLINKIAHMKEELEKNLNENYKANKDSMKIIFEQEKIRHEQDHFNNDIPLLKNEVNDMKTQLNNLNEQNQLFALQTFKFETEEKMFMNKKFNNNTKNSSILNKGSTNKIIINHTSPSINSHRITIPIKQTNSSNGKKTKSLILPKIDQRYINSQRLNPFFSLNSIKKLPKQKVLSKSESDLIRKVKQETNYISDIAKKSQILLKPHSLTTNPQPPRPIKSILKPSRNFPNTSPSISKTLTLDVIQEEDADPDEEPNVSFINDVPSPQNNKMSDIELLMQQRMSYQYYLPSNSVFKIKS